jgi:DNA-directed RNA polymerase subunit L
LVTLKPREQIRLDARAVLGVGLRDCCWQAASNFAIDDDTEEGKVIFMFKSASRFDEYALMDKALAYFTERLDLIANMMEKMYLLEESKTDTFIALINGEDYTIGTPLTYELQSHPGVIMASCAMPDSLEDRVKIEIVTDNPDNMVKIIKESTAALMAKIAYVQDQFAVIRHETYSKYLDKDGKSLFYDYDVIREEDPIQSKTPTKREKKRNDKTKGVKMDARIKKVAKTKKKSKSK